MSWHASLGISVLTGGRVDLLKRTLGSVERTARSALQAAHVVVYVNGDDVATRRYVDSLPFVNEVFSTPGRLRPFGEATSSVIARTIKVGRVRYLLHLEDDWECTATDGRWLEDARAILDEDVRVGQVRLRLSVEPVLTRHMITGSPIQWAPRGRHLVAPSAHYTSNPSLMRTADVRSVLPYADEGGGQRKFLATRKATAQLVPGAFRHIGGARSLINAHPPSTSGKAPVRAPPRLVAAAPKLVRPVPKLVVPAVPSRIVVPKAAPSGLPTSLIVPCVARHLRFLPDLLRHVSGQTVRPDELVLAVSECARLPPALEKALADYPGRAITHVENRKCYAGKNRNLGAAASSGAVLVYQDADDLPHPQRIEIILQAFRANRIDHLLHGYAHTSWAHHASLRAQWRKRHDVREVLRSLSRQPQYGRVAGVHNGHIATSRAVFQRIRWPESLRRGQDTAYNQSVYAAFKQTYVLRLPLVLYRQEHSSETISA